jgi:thermostable 8-oxoguanine DNA glycosylase
MNDLAMKYLYIKGVVIDKGYEDEIIWQSSRSLDNLDESTFMRELAWVVLSSGMKEMIIRRLFQDISRCFFYWKSSKEIVANKEKCLNDAVIYFNNRPKILAIIDAAENLNNIDFEYFKNKLYENPLEILQEFSYVGPITVYHLAKNIGLQFAKPDRHLARISSAAGYTDVQTFCKDISNQVGDSICVVDLVLWRFATLNKNYETIFEMQ